MKPSEVMRREEFQFEIKGEGKNRMYATFDACVRKVFPNANQETIPLTNCCPLFVGGTGGHLPAEIVNSELPAGYGLPDKPGVYFLCQAIERLAYGKLSLSKEAIIEIVERIEKRFEAEDLNWYGRAKGSKK